MGGGGRGGEGEEGRGGEGEGHIILNPKLEMITNIYIPCLFLKTNGLLSPPKNTKETIHLIFRIDSRILIKNGKKKLS